MKVLIEFKARHRIHLWNLRSEAALST